MQFLIPTSHWFTLTFLTEPAFTFPSKVETLRPMGYRVIWVKCNLYTVLHMDKMQATKKTALLKKVKEGAFSFLRVSDKLPFFLLAICSQIAP